MSQTRRPRHHLLIAEGEAHMASYLAERFTAQGFRTTVGTDGAASSALPSSSSPPGTPSPTRCTAWRAAPTTT
ncbi:hypothetical protein ACIBAG_12250 [Streptomyces sp. NPDC051243]|uniref:hypothetical protein n=1 Tax=Streptomyces sp. NPDC051243 TaxID=3365646 RepID=UPI0037A254F2